jgi:DMSO/TMAO reductase YedYZ molybdopterin-dependent catalytic subunit
MPFTRRNLFATLASAAVSSQLAHGADDPVAIAGKRPMILHNDRPEDLETPVRYFDSWITPIDAFFVRQHLPRPAAIDPDAYRLTVNGMVSKPLELTLADLRKLPQFTVPATIECTGNGRGFYTPKVPGIQWMRGAIGNAEWRGPRVSDVLKMAGVSGAATFIETDGAVHPRFRALPAHEQGHAPRYHSGARHEWPDSRDPRLPGAPDRSRVGRHQFGEVGGAHFGSGAVQYRLLHESRLPLPEI